MKVKNLVKQTKEYERLGGLISSLESVISDLEKIDSPVQKKVATTGCITMSGFSIAYTDGQFSIKESQHLTPSLNSELTFALKDELLIIFRKKLNTLKEEQELLEV